MLRAAMSATVLALILAIWSAVAPAWRPGPASEADRIRFDAACRQYRAEAAANGDAGFSARLSGACGVAQAALDGSIRRQQVVAARLLIRIARLSETIAEMNAGRAARGAAPVTATGEYLIAHDLGVVAALDLWLDSAPGFSLASHP